MELAIFNEKIETIKRSGNFRTLPHNNAYQKLINLSSNDYLGLASDVSLKEEFMAQNDIEGLAFSSASSRLLTGNNKAYIELESRLAELFGRESALVFSSGYHANTGILAAITTRQSLILADKLVHASIIDGMQLSKARNIRYRHNDYDQLERILIEESVKGYDLIIIVTESIFSMDGDEADLKRLTLLKKQYPNVLLYVDEAHSVGVRGRHGLGCAEECNCLNEIDLLVGTFGKAFASTGAFLICDHTIRELLINTMRTLIYTTALPPINLKWTLFILNRIPEMKAKRDHLHQISRILHTCCNERNGAVKSSSHIIPFGIGDNHRSVEISRLLEREGFYILPVRPPTVPEGTARLRISLTAGCHSADIERLGSLLHTYMI